MPKYTSNMSLVWVVSCMSLTDPWARGPLHIDRIWSDNIQSCHHQAAVHQPILSAYSSPDNLQTLPDHLLSTECHICHQGSGSIWDMTRTDVGYDPYQTIKYKSHGLLWGLATSFSYTGPTALNILLHHVKHVPSLETFKSQLISLNCEVKMTVKNMPIQRRKSTTGQAVMHKHTDQCILENGSQYIRFRATKAVRPMCT